MGIWDKSFKRLFFKYPADFARWLAHAEFINELNPNLEIQAMQADALMCALRRGRKVLLHAECQKRVARTKMGRRLWKYNSAATMQYGLPVITYVIYLKREERIAQSPYEIKGPDGEVIHRFYFHSIELYNIPTEELRAYGGVAGLALLPLTREGAHPEVVESIIQEVREQVVADDRYDLLSIMFSFASLAFERKEDQDWLTRRFEMLDDILKDTPFVKYLEARGEKRGEERGERRGEKRGEKIGLARGREEGFKQSLYAIISARFPALLTLAQEQTAHLTDTDYLNVLIVQMSVAQTEDDAREILLAAK